MAAATSQANNEAEIRALIDEWAAAFRAKNVDGLMANHSPDIVLFDVPEPLQHRGADAYRKVWERWLPTIEGPLGCEIRELSVSAGDDVAFSQPKPHQQQEGRRRDDRPLGTRYRGLSQDQR